MAGIYLHCTHYMYWENKFLPKSYNITKTLEAFKSFSTTYKKPKLFLWAYVHRIIWALYC